MRGQVVPTMHMEPVQVGRGYRPASQSRKASDGFCEPLSELHISALSPTP
jgi:hypothetical protein